MRKILSILLIWSMIASFMTAIAFADGNITWDANATVNNGVVTIPKKLSSQASFDAMSQNAVIEFDYEYLSDFTDGFLSFNIIGNTGEVFRTTFFGNAGGKITTTVYAKTSDSTGSSPQNDEKYSTEDLYAKKGTLQFAINLERRMVMIKHIDGVSKKVVMLTNDYLWGQNVTSVTGFKIGASQNPGIKITNFKAYIPENFDKYYSFAKKYTFEEFDKDAAISASGDYIGTSGSVTVAEDPENSSNKVAKIGNASTASLQLRAAKKEFGLNGDVYLKYRIRFTDVSTSTRPPYIYQFGTNSNITNGAGDYELMEVIATSTQWQVKNPDGTASATPNSRAANVWYDVVMYLNTDSNTVTMYVGNTLIGTADYTIRNGDFINKLIFTMMANTTYYVDDIEIGMYTPYTFSAEGVTINEDSSITGLTENEIYDVGTLLSFVYSETGIVCIKDAEGNVKSEAERLSAGDYVEVSDKTGNISEKYSLPETFDLCFTSKYMSFNNINGTASVKKGRTVNEIKSGLRFNIEDYSFKIVDTNGNLITSAISEGNIAELKLGSLIFKYTIVFDNSEDYIFNWDFTANIYPVSNYYVNQGNSVNGVCHYQDPKNANNKALGFITNNDNVNGTGTIFMRYNFDSGKTVSKNAVLEFDFYCDKFEGASDWIFDIPMLDGKYYGASGSQEPAMYVGINDLGGVKVYNGDSEITYNNIVKADAWSHFSVLIRDDFTYDVSVNGKKLNSDPLSFRYKGPNGCNDYEISRIQPNVIIKRGGSAPYVFNKVSLMDNIKLSNAKPEISDVKYNPYNHSLIFNYNTENACYSYTKADVEAAIAISDGTQNVQYTTKIDNMKNYFELLLSKEKQNVYYVDITNLKADFSTENTYSAKLTIDTAANSLPIITSSYGSLDFMNKTAEAYEGITAEKYLSGIDCTKLFTAKILNSDYIEKNGQLVDGDILRINTDGKIYDFVISIVSAIDYDINWDFENGVGTAMPGVVNYIYNPIVDGIIYGQISDPVNSSNKTAGIDTIAYKTDSETVIYPTIRYDTRKWDKSNCTYNDGGYSLKDEFVFQYDFYISNYNESDTEADNEVKLWHSMWKYFGGENSSLGVDNYGYNPIIDIRVKSNGELVAVTGERDTEENPNNGVYVSTGKIIDKEKWVKIAVVGLGNNTYNLYLNGEKVNSSPIAYRVTESDNNASELSPDRFIVIVPTGKNITNKKVLIDNVKAYKPTPILSDAVYYADSRTMNIALDSSYVSYEFEDTACQNKIVFYDENDTAISANVSFDENSGKIKAIFEKDLDTQLIKVKINDLMPLCGGNSLKGTYTYNCNDITVIEKVEVTANVYEDAGLFLADFTAENKTSAVVTIYLFIAGYESENKMSDVQFSVINLAPGETLNEDYGYLNLTKTTDDGIKFAKAFVMDSNLAPLCGSVSTSVSEN